MAILKGSCWSEAATAAAAAEEAARTYAKCRSKKQSLAPLEHHKEPQWVGQLIAYRHNSTQQQRHGTVLELCQGWGSICCQKCHTYNIIASHSWKRIKSGTPNMKCPWNISTYLNTMKVKFIITDFGQISGKAKWFSILKPNFSIDFLIDYI